MNRLRRPSTPPERRCLRKGLFRLRRVPRQELWSGLWIALVAEGMLFAVLSLAGGMSWRERIAVAVFAGFIVGLWAAGAQLRSYLRGLQSFKSAMRAGMASELRIATVAAVELEEAGYAFQIAPDEILFLVGREFTETVLLHSARFPNTDFGLVDLLDERGEVVAQVTAKYGARLTPLRCIPSEFHESQRLSPDYLDRAAGTLESLEAILASWPRDRLA